MAIWSAAVGFVVGGCSKQLGHMPNYGEAPEPVSEAQLGIGDSFIYDDWAVTPLEASLVKSPGKDGDRTLVKVKVRATNIKEGDLSGRKLFGLSTGWHAKAGVAIWPGTVSMADGSILGPHSACPHDKNLDEPNEYSTYELMQAAADISENESVKYTMCWETERNESHPPYVFYVGDWTYRHSATFDLGCLTYDPEQSECPVEQQ